MASSIGCGVGSLLCDESASDCCFDGDVAVSSRISLDVVAREIDDHVTLFNFPADDESAIHCLIAKEVDHLPVSDYLGRLESHPVQLKVREGCIGWFMKINAFYHLAPLSMFLAVNYLDRFWSSYSFPEDPNVVALIRIACMSLAMKMEETEVPIPVELQALSPPPYFSSATIRGAELSILTKLNWRTSSVTPYSYVDYYLYKLGYINGMPSSLLEAIIDFIKATLFEPSFLKFRPSVIAAAAVLCARGNVYKLQTIKVLGEIPGVKESITQCADLMMGMLSDPSFGHGAKRSRNAFPGGPHSPVGVLEAAALGSCTSESTNGSPRGSPSVSRITGPATKKLKI